MGLKTPIDQAEIRAQFPVWGKDCPSLVYLDNAATTQKPTVVLGAMDHANKFLAANVRRGAYRLSAEATLAFEKVRHQVADFIHANHTSEIIFTKGATEALNLVANIIGSRLEPDDEIVVTTMEHHANLVPWQLIAAARGAKIVPVSLLNDGSLDLVQLQSLITEKTKVVACVHISNVLGNENPIAKIAKWAHQQGAILVCDGAQAAGHRPIDVQALNCDFYAFSAHKMYGPFGVGVLYGRQALLEALPPWQGGGDMIELVELTQSSFAPPPYKFEAGTPNIAGVIAFGAALHFIQSLGWEFIIAHEQKLTSFLLETLTTLPGITLYGAAVRKVGIVAFNVQAIHPHDVSSILDAQHIAIRSGHLCAQPLIRSFHVPAVCRVSLGLYNNEQDICLLGNALKDAQRMFAA